MKTYTADEWIEGATLEGGVRWREADGSDVEIVVESGEPRRSYGLRGDAAGAITVRGSGDGSAYRIGGGIGGAYRYGSGEGSAYRYGSGEGSAYRYGSGEGSAYRAGIDRAAFVAASRPAKPHEITWQNTRKSIREAVYLELFNAMGVAQRATTGCADLGLQRLSARQLMLADAYSAAIDILRDAERASEDSK